MNKPVPSMCVDLNDPAQCNAVFEAKNRAHLMELLRQCQAAQTNAETQRDYEQERNEGWSVR